VIAVGRTARDRAGARPSRYVHPCNLGHGANQKTCCTEALRHGADIVVMVHPDYQYDGRIENPPGNQGVEVTVYRSLEELQANNYGAYCMYMKSRSE